MNFNFQEWLLILEELKPKALAFKILGNTVDNAGKPVLSTDPNIIKTTNEFNKIFSASIPEAQQKNIYPTAAYVYKTNPSVGEAEFSQDLKDYYKFVIANQLPVLSFNDDGNVTGNYIIGKPKDTGNPYSHYIHWASAVHSKNSENEDEEKKKFHQSLQKSTGDVSDQELVAKSPDEKIKVYKANAVDKCIILGRGQKFCISQPGNSQFHGYRNTKDSTFYFVYDNTRNDDLKVVVVDATRRGIEITDGKNDTAKTMQDPYETTPKIITSNSDLYLKYLKGKGVDTTVFKNERKTPKEEAENEKLGKGNLELAWFRSLTYEERKNYIGRGHTLSDEQFNFLFTTRSEPLLKIYVSTGIILYSEQLNLVLNNPYFKDLKLNYLNARMHNFPNKHLFAEEYLAMPPKQKQELVEKYGDKLKDYIEIKNIKIKYYVNLPEDKKTEIKNLFGNDFFNSMLNNSRYSLKIEDYLNLPEDKKTEIKNLSKDNVYHLFGYQSTKVEDYLSLPEDKRTELENLLGDNYKRLIIFNSINIEDYLNFPENKKAEIKNLLGNDSKDLIKYQSIKIEDYLNFPEDKKTEIKNFLGYNYRDLIMYRSIKIEDYLNFPENKKAEIKKLFGDSFKSYLISDHSGSYIKAEDYLNLPEDKKTEIKNFLGDSFKDYVSNFYDLFRKYEKNPSLEFNDEIKNLITCKNADFVSEILRQPNKNNVKFLTDFLRSSCKGLIDDILSSGDSIRDTFDEFYDKKFKSIDKVKVINLLHLLSTYSNQMPMRNISNLISNIRAYLGSSSKYIVMFRKFFQNFASKLQDAKEVNRDQEDMHHSDVSKNHENTSIKLFADILSSFGKILDKDAISTIKFIVDTIGNEKIPRTTRDLIKEKAGEEGYKSIFPEQQQQQQASPEDYDKAYRGDSTREGRDYKMNRLR